MGPKLASNARIIITPGEIRLIPVRDRGIVYDVPTKYLGEDLGSVTLLKVAERADGQNSTRPPSSSEAHQSRP